MIDPSVEETIQMLYINQVEHGKCVSCDDAHGSDDGMTKALRLGLVEKAAGEHRLTQDGIDLGRDVVRRHRLAERLLQDVLTAGAEVLHEGACRVEHALLPEIAEKVCILLGHPSTCPHGRPIPPGACCKRMEKDRIRHVAPLCDGRPGDEGTVAYLSTRDNREVQKMMAMGILPGANIKLIQRFPSYVFQVGYSQFAVDRPLAEMIYVHWSIPGQL